MAGSLVFAGAGGGWAVGVLLRCFFLAALHAIGDFPVTKPSHGPQGRSLVECRKPGVPGLGWCAWRCFVGLVVGGLVWLFLVGLLFVGLAS